MKIKVFRFKISENKVKVPLPGNTFPEVGLERHVNIGVSSEFIEDTLNKFISNLHITSITPSTVSLPVKENEKYPYIELIYTIQYN